jgi:hypothetical protein
MNSVGQCGQTSGGQFRYETTQGLRNRKFYSRYESAWTAKKRIQVLEVQQPFSRIAEKELSNDSIEVVRGAEPPAEAAQFDPEMTVEEGADS